MHPTRPPPSGENSPLSDPRQPTELLFYRLAKLSAITGRLVTRLCERRYGITRREWGVLMWLAQEPGLRPSALAERLELDRARISRAIATLLDKRLIDKTPNLSNRRESQLHLTAAGAHLHEELWPQIREINQSTLQALGNDTVQALDRALESLQKQAQAMELELGGDEADYPARRAGSRTASKPRGPRSA